MHDRFSSVTTQILSLNIYYPLHGCYVIDLHVVLHSTTLNIT